MKLKLKKHIAGAIATALGCTSTILPTQAISVPTLENKAITAETELEIGDRGVTSDGIMWQVDNTFGKGMAIRGYEGTSTTITIPDTINGLKVTGIGANAFKGKNITKITLPALYRIGSSAFQGCTSLSSITFQSKQMQIDENAFKNCSSLSSVTYYGTADFWEKSMMNNSMIASGNDDLLHCTFTDADGVTFIPLGNETADYDHSYAEIKAVEGFYTKENNIGFKAEQVESLVIYDVYDDGSVVQRANIDMSLINFNNLSPEHVYNPANITFAYDVPVYYGDMPLYDEDGNELCIPAYIGIMGDVDLNSVVDASDASYIIRYYNKHMLGYPSDKLQLSENSLVTEPNDIYDEFSAFLADITQINDTSDNWKLKKSDRMINATDASIVLSYYAYVSAEDYYRETRMEDFVNGRFDLSPVVASADGGYTKDEIHSSNVMPKLSVSQIEIDEYDVHMNNRVVTVDVYLDGYNLDQNWNSLGIKLKYDTRLIVEPYYSNSWVKFSDNARDFFNSSESIENGSIFVSLVSHRDLGFKGNLFTCTFIVPDDVRPGDLFDIEIEYVPGSIFTNTANDEQGRLMQAYLFTEGIENGYIKIKEPPVTTTATKATTAPTTQTTTTTTKSPEQTITYGDANCDGVVSIADSTAILQHLGNKDKYALSAQGEKNADVDGKAGITASDALAIQQYDAKLVSKLPVA